MVWVLLAYVFWLALNGRLGVYAGFLTTANAAGGLGAQFSGLAIPLKLSLAGTGSGVVGALTGQTGIGQPKTGAVTGSGQAMTGPDVMSATPPGTNTNPFGYLTGPQDNGSNIYSPTADSLKYLQDAQSNVRNGVPGM